MPAWVTPWTEGSTENGLFCPSPWPPLFVNQFRAAHGVPIPGAIATGVAGPCAGGTGADDDHNSPHLGKGDSVASLLYCRPIILANFWTNSGGPPFQRRPSALL